jgi:subtilisin family serine protease
MNYFDKSRQRPITLDESDNEFLVKTKETDQAEMLSLKIAQRDEIESIKPVKKDKLFIVRFNKKSLSMRKRRTSEIESLRNDAAVESVSPIYQDSDGLTRYAVTDSLLVSYDGPKKQALLSRIPAQMKVTKESSYGNWIVVNIRKDKRSLSEIIDLFNQFDEVRFAEPVYYGINDTESNGSIRWNHLMVNAQNAWNIQTGSSTVLVAVIDGEPDLTHAAFDTINYDSIRQEWRFSNDGEFSSHATQIFSIISGNSEVIKGFAPGIQIFPAIVSLQAQYYHERAEAIYYLESLKRSAVFNGKPIRAVIANCSWKTAGDISIIREAIRSAAQAGVFIVTSAGNENVNTAHYPSDYASEIDQVVCVAALDPLNRKAEYSNYSPHVTISAPGGAGLPFDDDDIYCADNGGKYTFSAGTSFAAPHVTAAVALMLSVNPELDAKKIKGILQKTAYSLHTTDPSFAHLLGYGGLDMASALLETQKTVQSTEPVVPTQPDTPTDPRENDQPVEPAGNGPVITINTGTTENTTSIDIFC